MNPNENELNPQLQTDSDLLRAARQRERYGPDTTWDKEFAPVDDSTERARVATQKMRDHLAASGTDPDRPMRFNVTVAGRTARIEVREQDGEFSCSMPVEVAPGIYEHRTLLAKSYDGLIATINRVLRSAPSIRELTESERIELARACSSSRDNLSAVVEKYLQLRLGDVDDKILDDPRFLSVCNDAVIFVFAHTTPEFPNTPDAIAYIKKFAAGRPLNMGLCRAAFKNYRHAERTAADEPQPPQVTETDLTAASDKNLRDTMRGLARARADADRKRRELIYGRGQ